MGYYTSHILKVYPSSQTSDVRNSFKKNDCDYFDSESVKWYECDADCKNVSKQHPGVLISVYGDGEDSFDFWRDDFLNGEKISFWKLAPIEIPDADIDLIERVESEYTDPLTDLEFESLVKKLKQDPRWDA